MHRRQGGRLFKQSGKDDDDDYLRLCDKTDVAGGMMLRFVKNLCRRTTSSDPQQQQRQYYK